MNIILNFLSREVLLIKKKIIIIMYIIDSAYPIKNLSDLNNVSAVNIGELTLQYEEEIVFSQIEQGALLVLVVLMMLLINLIRSKSQ